MMKSLPILTLLLGCFWAACDSDSNNKPATAAALVNYTSEADPFEEYWYTGLAEVNSYDLQQSRYGEMRQGDAVLVFVTEPFSASKQVKLDNPERAGNDNVSVLKTNAIRKFNTGIYDYSMMTSVFTPVQLDQFPSTLKLTTTSQEWCGHTFTQFNLKGKNYLVSEYSYFEEEGDIEKNINAALLEDELFNRIRIRPESIPVGNVDMIPSNTFTRLSHQAIKPTKVTITKTEQATTVIYKIEYLHLPRTLTIETEKAFPRKILSWSEDGGDGLITKATLKQTLKIDYWSKNSNQYESLRADLGLD